jgi:hypothetical protein
MDGESTDSECNNYGSVGGDAAPEVDILDELERGSVHSSVHGGTCAAASAGFNQANGVSVHSRTAY